ncbi:MAG: ribosomal protein S18-alanine N-acetyltransferase [Lachnospiraceae bacterium]
MIVRLMNEAEIAAIADIEKRMFSASWSEETIRDSWNKMPSTFLVAVDKERIIGFLIFFYVLDEGEIIRIVVEKKYQRKGVGSLLFAELEKICREKEIIKLMLEVRKSNFPAVKFYRKHGFETDGIRKDYYGTPSEDAVLMSREII